MSYDTNIIHEYHFSSGKAAKRGLTLPSSLIFKYENISTNEPFFITI